MRGGRGALFPQLTTDINKDGALWLMDQIQ